MYQFNFLSLYFVVIYHKITYLYIFHEIHLLKNRGFVWHAQSLEVYCRIFCNNRHKYNSIISSLTERAHTYTHRRVCGCVTSSVTTGFKPS